MVTTQADAIGAKKSKRFSDTRRSDRNFYLSMLIAIWTAILSGFVYHNVQKFAAGTLRYPIIVHVHAVVFVGWLLLFTTQVLSVRSQNLRWHRSFGRVVAAYAILVIVLGIATGIRTEQLKFGTPDADTRFLITMFGDMLCFGALIAGGYYWRTSSDVHKRLMLMATIVMTDAGLGRGFTFMLEALAGGPSYWEVSTAQAGFIPYVRFQLVPVFILQGAIGVYDLVTRGRLHPAYVIALGFTSFVGLCAGWLYFQPFWGHIALRIIGQ